MVLAVQSNKKAVLVIDALQHGARDGTVWRPAEVDVSIRPGWFYHPGENERVRAVDNLVSLCPFHHDSVSRGDYLMAGDPTRPDGLDVVTRWGLPIGPPPWRDLAPPPEGDPPTPAGYAEYEPPTEEVARWSEIEIPPDVELLRSG